MHSSVNDYTSISGRMVVWGIWISPSKDILSFY